MIKDEQEYRVTKDWTEKYSRGIAVWHKNEEKRKKDPDGWQLILDYYQYQIETLTEEMREYETLTDSDPNEPVRLTITEFDEIAEVLIKARIAFKISQKELGYLCDRTEEEIKQYEAADYQNAQFIDVLAVGDALGIKIQEGVFIAELDDFYKTRLAKSREVALIAPQRAVSP